MILLLSFLSLPFSFFFFTATATTAIYTLSLHDALPIFGWQLDRPGLIHRLSNFIARNLPRTRSETDATLAVDSPHVTTRYTNRCVLDRRPPDIFGLFDPLLNGRHRLIQLHADPLARPAPLRGPVP